MTEAAFTEVGEFSDSPWPVDFESVGAFFPGMAQVADAS